MNQKKIVKISYFVLCRKKKIWNDSRVDI